MEIHVLIGDFMNRVKHRLLLVLLFLIPILPSFAQDAWYNGKVIEDIQFEGLYMISSNELDGVVDSYIGKQFDDNLFMELQNKLFSLDYFEDMTSTAYPGREDISKYDPENTVIIKFKMVEYPSISKIKIAGNKNIRKNTILEEIMLKPGDVVTGANVKLDEERIHDLYLEKGFNDVVVHGEIGEKDSDNTVLVTFRIDEGYQMRIREIVFVGNNVISKTALKRKLESKQQGLFRKGLYQESNIEEDIENIENFYAEKG